MLGRVCRPNLARWMPGWCVGKCTLLSCPVLSCPPLSLSLCVLNVWGLTSCLLSFVLLNKFCQPLQKQIVFKLWGQDGGFETTSHYCYSCPNTFPQWAPPLCFTLLHPLHCKVTAMSLESLCFLFGWQTSLQQFFVCVCVFAVPPFFIGRYNLIRINVCIQTVFGRARSTESPLMFCLSRYFFLFCVSCSKPERSRRKNLSATPCSRRSRPCRRRRRPWRSTMKRRRNFSPTNCRGSSCKWVMGSFH